MEVEQSLSLLSLSARRPTDRRAARRENCRWAGEPKRETRTICGMPSSANSFLADGLEKEEKEEDKTMFSSFTKLLMFQKSNPFRKKV